jgi:hypothetical protein
MIKYIDECSKKYLLSVLKVILKIDDIEIVKYTIQSLIEELEEADHS